MPLADFMFTPRQQRILGALLMNPRARYSLSDLIRLAGPGNGATQRTVAELHQADVLVRSDRGNQRLYAINETHPLYPELRSICLKTFGLAEQIRIQLTPLAGSIERAFVFGSIAKDADRPDSDIDFMVIGDVDLFDLAQVIEELQVKLGRPIDLNLHTPQEWAALQNDRVVLSILAGKTIDVING